MNIIDYYKHDFYNDLITIMNTSTHAKKRISIISFLESMDVPNHFNDAKKAFLAIDNKPFFLFSYFYSVLLDQSLHNVDKSLHDDFNKIAQYPKLGGILSSYHENFHPANLLLIATVYTKNDKKFTDSFNELTDWIIDDYIDFFQIVFPQHTVLIPTREDQNESIGLVFMAMNTSNFPGQLWNQVFDLDEYSNWTKYFNSVFVPKREEFKSFIRKRNYATAYKLRNLE